MVDYYHADGVAALINSAADRQVRSLVNPTRPRHLTERNASVFADEAVVAAYGRKPCYHPSIVARIVQLADAETAAMLDLGCGRGDLTLPLCEHFSRVDAVDVSTAMLDAAMVASADWPQASRICWIRGRAEVADFSGPYGLAVAGDSLHWMEWDQVLPRVALSLSDSAPLVIVNRYCSTGLTGEREVVDRYSRLRDFQPYHLVQELLKRRLFVPQGHQVWSYAWQPTLDEYVTTKYACGGCTRLELEGGERVAFEIEIRAFLMQNIIAGVLPYDGERLNLPVTIRLRWGRPV